MSNDQVRSSTVAQTVINIIWIEPAQLSHPIYSHPGDRVHQTDIGWAIGPSHLLWSSRAGFASSKAVTPTSGYPTDKQKRSTRAWIGTCM